MKAFNKSLSLLVLWVMSFAAPLSLEANDDHDAGKIYTPSRAISSIYQELRENPDKYDLEKAGESTRAAIREYGIDRAYPLLKEAILEQDYLTEVRNFFVILMETEKGRAVAEETALTLLHDGSVDTPKQLVALRVVGDLGNHDNESLVRTYLDSEDRILRLKAGEILDDWEVDSADNTNPVEVIEEVTAPEAVIEKSAEAVATEPTEKPVEQSSNWWLWLIGVVVVVGGIALTVRRKS